MSDEKRERYDLEAVYDEKVSPLMAQIIAICKEHRMPVFASFACSDDEDEDKGYGFCTTFIHFDGRRPEPLLKANREVRSDGHTTFAMVITSEPK